MVGWRAVCAGEYEVEPRGARDSLMMGNAKFIGIAIVWPGSRGRNEERVPGDRSLRFIRGYAHRGGLWKRTDFLVEVEIKSPSGFESVFCPEFVSASSD